MLQSSDDDLAFQDIEHTSSPPVGRKGSDARLLESGQEAQPDGTPTSTAAGYLSIEAYQKWFDVSTKEVLRRVLRSAIPSKSPFYNAGEVPDLYAPFWLTSTLIVLIVMGSNLDSYLSTEDHLSWKADFRVVTTAASLLYSWVFLLPIGVYLLLKKISGSRSFVEVVSIYGYSMISFVPTAILCMFRLPLVRWVATFTSVGLSSLFLFRNLIETLEGESRLGSSPVLVTAVGAQIALGFILKLYFFNY